MIAKKKTRSSGSASLRGKTQSTPSSHPQRTPEMSGKEAEKLIDELEAQNQELREKEKEFEEARTRYLDLYDFAPVGYFVLSREGKIIDLNLAGTKLFGLPRNHLIGMPFTFFLPGHSLHEFNKYLNKVFSSNKKETGEFPVIQKYQKSVAYVSIESVALNTDKGATCRSAVIDITERKSAEQELIKARQESIERNAQLQRLSSRLFDVHEEEKIQVACDVHDSFASMLCVMKNQLQTFLGKGEDDKLNQILHELDSAIQDALRIQKILRPPVLDDLGLFPALNMLCREFQDSHPRIHVEKKFLLEEGRVPDSIVVPIYRIAQQTLENVALHSSADWVSFSLVLKDSFIEFAIRDNGQGFNVEETLASGMGKGLSMMKERAVVSGGLFSIESEPGKGTTLRVAWPFG